MKDFLKPHGSCSGMAAELKLNLFERLTSVLSGASLAVFATLSMQEYEDEVVSFVGAALAKGTVNPYAQCFGVCVRIIAAWADSEGIKEPIGYVLDEGNPYREHVLDTHAALKEYEKLTGASFHVGPIGFDSDTEVWALQAA